jgi:hypothetical protein
MQKVSRPSAEMDVPPLRRCWKTSSSENHLVELRQIRCKLLILWPFFSPRLLFRKADLSEIKRYCIDEWTKILQGKISFQDLIISKEVKLGSYSENGLPPPGAVIAGRRLAEDPMDEAEYGERVPFIITKHGASDRLVHKARAPEDLLNDR